MSVHVSQFYACSKVTLASELLYICELGKYSKINYDEAVDLDGVTLTSQLKKSLLWDYFRMAVNNGWLVNSGVSPDELAITAENPLHLDKQNHCNMLFTTDDVGYDSEEMAHRRQDLNFDIRTPVKSKVSFESMNSALWVWSPKGKNGGDYSVNNKSLNHNFADMAWVSLVAMIAVHRVFEGNPQNLLLRISGNMLLNPMALSHLMAIDDMTQCLKGWLFYEFDETVSDNTKLQLSYYAWYSIGRELGMLDRWYDGKEKLAYMRKLGIEDGDLVLYYEREPAQSKNYIKGIASFCLAKVVSASTKELKLELIHTTKPKYAGKVAFDDHSMAVKMMYTEHKPYENLLVSTQTIDMAEIGIEYMLHSEYFFIVPLNHANDTIPTRVTDGVRDETLLLDQNNLIYWILEDYGYEYNRQRFLERYFNGVEPLRDRYLRGDAIESCYYPKG